MSVFEKYFPWGILGVGILYLVFFTVPRDDDPRGFAYGAAGQIPVTDNGRIKPLDTVARVNLMLITGGRQTFRRDDDSSLEPAIVWLLDVMSERFAYEKAMSPGIHEPALVIDNPTLFKRIKPRADGGKYSLADLIALPKESPPFFHVEAAEKIVKELHDAGQELRAKPAESRDADEAALLAIDEQVQAHWGKIREAAFAQLPSSSYKVFRIESEEVLSLLGLEPRPRFRYALSEFSGRLKEFYDVANLARETPREARSRYQVKVLEVAQRLERHVALVTGMSPLSIPLDRGRVWAGMTAARTFAEEDPLTIGFTDLLRSYGEGNVEGFNNAAAKYRAALDRYGPDLIPRYVGFEAFFNHANPFFHAQHLYMLVFLFGCLSWLAWSEPFRKAGLYLAVMTLAVHTLALLGRMYIMQRPFVFVTNLYSSAIFIGWGAVLTGVILDYIFKNGIGVAAAGAVGYATLVIAGYLGLSGDTLDPLEAVLDTNFWLATHVTTVTFGYTATFLAGAIGLAYILLGMFTPLMAGERSQVTNKMLYGVICFAMLLSFVGTVLGGIWADQSWGRFWGWDPKENGALLIVIWNALILHARWGGMIKTRGMAVLAVLGNCVTAWSWFGTNMLGVGLHSYGFMQGAVFWLLFFVGTQALVALVAVVVPQDMWRSYSPLTNGSSKWTRVGCGVGGVLGVLQGLLQFRLYFAERGLAAVVGQLVAAALIVAFVGALIGMIVDTLVAPGKKPAPAAR